jgi:transglutaminase-like putative cysteine protease
MQFLSGRTNNSGTIGLGRTATLGKVFNPYPSARRVIQFTGWPGEHHLRAATFDQYAAGTWGPPIDQREFGPVTPERLAPEGAGGTEVLATRYDDAFGLVCLPLEAAAVHVDGETVELQQDAGGAVRTAGNAPLNPLDYSFRASKEGGPSVIARPITDAERKWDLIVPAEIDPRVVRIAHDVATGGVAEKLARIQRYLQSNHHYSLEVDPGDGDPVSSFILKKLDGHCEYFAASTVVLARAAGIPARYVVGYYAHEKAGDGGTVVRERDAHAWAECWVDGAGWVTVDATPTGGRPDALFTETPAWRRAWERVQDYVHAVRTWLARRTLMEGAVMIAALAAIPVFIRVFKGRTARRKKVALATYAPPTPELAALARRFERLLRRRDLACPPNRTWHEHLASLPGCAEFLRQYNAFRFGNEGSIESLGRTLEQLENTGRP